MGHQSRLRQMGSESSVQMHARAWEGECTEAIERLAHRVAHQYSVNVSLGKSERSMSLLGRLRPTVLRNFRPKAGDSHASEPFLSAGKNQPTGYLFNETPPPPGQKRKLESWELPW